MDIKFHCNLNDMFPTKEVRIKAFLYRDYSIELHTHDFYELNIILAGSGMHQIVNTTVPVHRGNVFIIPPQVPHAYFGTENLDVFHIVLSDEVIKNNMAEASKMTGFLLFTEIEPYLRATSPTNLFLKLSDRTLLALQNDIDIIDQYGSYGLPGDSPLIVHTVWKLLYFFSYELSRQVSNPAKIQSKYEEQILKILEYMHAHFGEKITVESLSRMAFMSRSTFLRTFENVCGTAPMKYLDEYRCNQAKKMLESKAMSKSEIAHVCGFYDLSHMEKRIKTASKKKP